MAPRGSTPFWFGSAFVAGVSAGALAGRFVGAAPTLGVVLLHLGILGGLLAAALVMRRREGAARRATLDVLTRRALALDNVGDGVVVVDREDVVVEWTPSASRMYGFTAEDAVGRKLHALLSARVIGAELPELLRAMEGGLDHDTVESVHRRKDGRELHVEVVASALRAGGVLTAVVLVLRDVTERRALRARLERADRLAALGTLAAGVAHEVNNPVAYVTANLSFVRDALQRQAAGGAAPPLAELRQAVDEALGGAARVREIVAGLKQFATPGERAPSPVDLRAELDAAVGMTRHEVAPRARLVVELPERLPAVVAAPLELGQVFVNLLVNAAHAIPEGRAAEHEVRLTARAEGARVVVEVRDTGAGIPPDVLPRIFDPFFTTKAVGEGTGLGLSICHGIVNAAGGTIQAESTPGQGSLFRVILPASPAASPPAPAPAPVAPGRGRVLVVDDEPLVGRALARILSGAHEVTVTTSPLDALARLEHGERFHVVLCDLNMPEMSGMELEARIAERAPEMVGRLLFMTGGAFTPAARAFLDAGRPHLEKPIDSAVLRALVAERAAAVGGPV